MIELVVNQTHRRLDGGPATPLPWYLRDDLGLMRTRFGGGAGLCGCCQSGHIMQVASDKKVAPATAAKQDRS